MAETRHSLYNFLPFSITDLALSLTWKFEDKCAVNFSGSGKFSKLFHTLWCECRGCWIPRCAQDGVVHTAHCTCSWWCFLFLFYQKNRIFMNSQKDAVLAWSKWSCCCVSRINENLIFYVSIIFLIFCYPSLVSTLLYKEMISRKSSRSERGAHTFLIRMTKYKWPGGRRKFLTVYQHEIILS